MKKYLNQTNGFTLVELIISIALIGLIASFFLALFTSGFANIIGMGNKTKAMNNNAMVIMDEIYKTPSLISSVSNDEIDLGYGDNVTINVASGGSIPTGLKKVEIEVFYAPDRSVKLTSLVPSS
ncbi:type II secretion system protein [Acidaminobacter hydrogenoformans]|uniref:Prepilin-type N-terminal cleavage/methylation domain-containing protein n=1 Tax=Acidaminobacter hydrogenoformans DSM 2784 TaxID=1120920 RepID=A0A1G5S7Q2_9FIRM|nr:type II secretion system protein [Acidaminobacter hydrogenoformans]SCZ81731.1 prepilin-type N-terminal cleavage/methylation domain-containing protein [Acidaminobacter hydrogenoformans DSM 2784]